MGKYQSSNDDIYSIFAAPAWTATGIRTLPDDYTNTTGLTEFLRVVILATGASIINPPKSLSGQLMIDIFIPAGQGLKRLNQIADLLDTYLAGKSMMTSSGGSTQLGVSTLNPIGTDSANPSLYRGTYSISFNYFGI